MFDPDPIAGLANMASDPPATNSESAELIVVGLRPYRIDPILWIQDRSLTRRHRLSHCNIRLWKCKWGDTRPILRAHLSYNQRLLLQLRFMYLYQGIFLHIFNLWSSENLIVV